MTKVKIYFNHVNYIEIGTKKSFQDFIKDLFKKKIYMSVDTVDDSPDIAINTDNILYVWEEK